MKLRVLEHSDITTLTDATIHVIQNKYTFRMLRDTFLVQGTGCYFICVLGTDHKWRLRVSWRFVFVVGDIVILAHLFRARTLSWMVFANSD